MKMIYRTPHIFSMQSHAMRDELVS